MRLLVDTHAVIWAVDDPSKLSRHAVTAIEDPANVGKKGIRPIIVSEKMAGSPRAVTRPRLPQIRTCAVNASGSSSHGFAAGRRYPWALRGHGVRTTESPSCFPPKVPRLGNSFPPLGPFR